MAMAAASRPSGPVLSILNFRSASPTRLKLATGSSPGKSISLSSPSAANGAATSRSKRACMCSPTNHPGSFRCSLHKERKQEAPAGHSKAASPPSPPSLGSGVSSGLSSLGAKRMGSALARVGGAVESGTWARRALAPSPHRRRAAGGFRPLPSCLSAMSFAGAAPATTASE